MIYKLEEIKVIANEIFGEERVDEWEKGLMIHFPLINITNSKGDTHIIKDLFFRISLQTIDTSRDRKANIACEGTRTTYSIKELDSKYTHSHLSEKAWRSFSEFCLGSSNFNVLRITLQLTLDENDWWLFLLSIENYLKWESTEGGPYKYMKEINYNSSTDSSQYVAELERLMNIMPYSIFEFNDDLSVNSASLVVYNFFNTHSSIRSSQFLSPEQMLIKKRYWEEEAAKRKTSLIWKGEPFPIVIEAGEVGQNTISPSVIGEYVNLLNIKCKQFTKKLSYEQHKQRSNTLKTDRINFLPNILNNREAPKADRVVA